jgi:hypothetical protein
MTTFDLRPTAQPSDEDTELVDLSALRQRFPGTEQSTPSSPGTVPSAEIEPAPIPDVTAREDVTNATLIFESQMMTYPYRAIGKIQRRKPGSTSWSGAGSGVLVGPWHLLTASHVLNGDPAGTQYRFAPAYYDSDQSGAGFSWSTARIINRIGINLDHVSGYDYLICELDNPLGSDWGWWSTKGSTNDGFYTNVTWNTVGYPGNLQNGQWPYKNGVFVTGVDDDDHNGKAIHGRSDLAGGWSGGPLVGPGLGIWGDVVGVASGANDGGDQPGQWEDVTFAGGPDMVRLVKWGLDNWYRWVAKPENMTSTFGYTKPRTGAGVAAVSWGKRRIDLLWRSADNHLRHAWYPHHGGWSWEQDMTAGYGLTPSASAPATGSSEPGRIDLFWRSADDHLRHIWYPYHGDWSWEQDMTSGFGHGPAKGAPALTSWGPGRLDLLWREGNDHLGHSWLVGSDWSGTEDMSDMFISTVHGTPAASTWQPLRLDFFWVDGDKNIQHAWYANATG